MLVSALIAGLRLVVVPRTVSAETTLSTRLKRYNSQCRRWLMNPVRMKYLPVVVLSMFLVSCQSPQQRLEAAVRSIPMSELGYVIGEHVVDCYAMKPSCRQGFNLVSVKFRSEDDAQIEGRIVSEWENNWGDTKYDEIDPSTKEASRLFCEMLPPGNYAFFDVSYYNIAGGGSGYSLRKADQFRLPFNVQSGEVVDIGRLKQEVRKGKNLFQIKMPFPGQLVLSGLSDEDRRLAIAKCPTAARHLPVRQAPLADAYDRSNDAVRIAGEEQARPEIDAGPE